jgi:hypothetical protein
MKTATREAIFDEAFADFGGRANLEDYGAGYLLALCLDTYRRFLAGCEAQLAAQGTKVRLHFDFVANDQINAATCKSRGVYLLGLNVGTADRLARLFSSVLSWPEILPVIGDPSKEVAVPFDVAGCLALRRPVMGERSKPGASQFLMPRNKARRNAAICMNLMAMDFVVAHELAHALGGHVDFLDSLNVPARLNANGTGHVSSAMRRALELQADRDAALMLASALFIENDAMPPTASSATAAGSSAPAIVVGVRRPSTKRAMCTVAGPTNPDPGPSATSIAASKSSSPVSQ